MDSQSREQKGEQTVKRSLIFIVEFMYIVATEYL
jgi:hypothetical protein